MNTLVIASRESALAMWQARHIQHCLQTLYPKMDIRILGLTTQGDRILDKTLSKIGGKGLFVKELETALANGEADLAVHSMKDVPMTLPDGFQLAAICAREDPRDAFVANHYTSLAAMPAGAVIGTSSLRRESQIRAAYPHLIIRPLRGNVQTRLQKLDNGEYDAIILAAAGLIRLGLDQRITALLRPSESLPAAGQGALGIEIHETRPELMSLLAPLNDRDTADCVTSERILARALNGSCQVPLGAFATLSNNQITLGGLISSIDGQTRLTATASAPRDYAKSLGKAVAQQLIDAGALPLIDHILANNPV